jgi:hypothetical protein
MLVDLILIVTSESIKHTMDHGFDNLVAILFVTNHRKDVLLATLLGNHHFELL